MEINNNCPSNTKNIRGLRNIIKTSMHKNAENKNNNPIIESNLNNNINNNMVDNNDINIYSNYKKGANNINSINENNNNIRSLNNNIEEIVIKTNCSKNKLNNNNTTPFPVCKQNNKNKLGLVKLNIKKLILNNKNDSFFDNNEYSNDERIKDSLENYKRKTFSQSFGNMSKFYINEDKNNTFSLENKTIINTPKMNRYYKKILFKSDKIKTKTNNINNHININPTDEIKKNQVNNKYMNKINDPLNNLNNVTFDTSIQNDYFNYTDINNQSNESKYVNKNIQNEISLKIKENKEIKKNLLLMMEDLNKIKEKQDMILKNQKENKIISNERNNKIRDIIIKTYNFLNDFNSLVNEQNNEILQEIYNNLNIIFSD